MNCKFAKILIIALCVMLLHSVSVFSGLNSGARIIIDYDAYSPLLDEECLTWEKIVRSCFP